MVDRTQTHSQHEDNPWTIDIVNHASRTDSKEYRRSRTLMGKLVAQVQPWWFGDAPYQDHHGGGIWLLDATGWMLVFGPAGIDERHRRRDPRTAASAGVRRGGSGRPRSRARAPTLPP